MVNLLYDFAISKRHPIFVQITADRTFKNALEKIQLCDSQDIIFFQSAPQQISSIYPKWCLPAYIVYIPLLCFFIILASVFVLKMINMIDWYSSRTCNMTRLSIFRIRSRTRIKRTWWATTSKWLSQVCLKWSYIFFLHNSPLLTYKEYMFLM